MYIINDPYAFYNADMILLGKSIASELLQKTMKLGVYCESSMLLKLFPIMLMHCLPQHKGPLHLSHLHVTQQYQNSQTSKR
ncbi:hypothetical protein EXN66_Car014720 [Channa argus]|uniref:Uncharacterized protein n=1 Tax=Channa argus TaxID=215402 RepID=A0A6G1Q9M7_CHAAH|nr:hypothetical protein EXN66_Car014720 [Channa argus]